MMKKARKVTGHRLFLPLSCLLIVLLINPVTTPTFFKISITDGVLYGYTIDVINCASELAVLTVGMTLIMLAPAETDIPAGAAVAVIASVCTHVLVGGEVSVNEYANPYILAALADLVVAVLCGCFSGLLVTKLKIQPMVATLILFAAGRGISRLVTNGQIIYIHVDGYRLLGSDIPGIPVPTSIFVAVLAVILTYVLLKRTTMGMYVQAVSINRRASRLVGLKPTKIIWMACAFCGPCAGIAGLAASPCIYSTDVNNIGLNIELDTIAAVALGGNSLGGGKFSLPGSVIGAYTIQVPTTTLYAMSVPSGQILIYKTIVVIIVAAVQSEEFKKLKERSTAKYMSKTVEGGAT